MADSFLWETLNIEYSSSPPLWISGETIFFSTSWIFQASGWSTGPATPTPNKPLTVFSLCPGNHFCPSVLGPSGLLFLLAPFSITSVPMGQTISFMFMVSESLSLVLSAFHAIIISSGTSEVTCPNHIHFLLPRIPVTLINASDVLQLLQLRILDLPF